MSIVESINAATIGSKPAGLGGRLSSFFMGLFGAVGLPANKHISRSIDIGEDSAAAKGGFVVAPGGYRIRVPHPADVGHSVGNMLPSVREGLALLPPLPTVVTALLGEIGDSKSTAASVAEVASSDPAIAALLLRTANSATTGLSHTINSVSEAINYLGVGTIKAMVVGLRLDETPAYKNERAAQDAEDLWVHSLAVSYVAEHLAKRHGEIDPAFVATIGLLHDIGKLAVLAQLPEEAEPQPADESDKSVSRLEVESRILGMDHACLGANLAAKWKLPADLIQAIRWHHRPSSAFHASDPLPLRKAVHILQIANQLVKYCYPHTDRMEIDPVSDDIFALLGLEPSLVKLLDGGVRDEIGRAMFFAASATRRPASAPRRFLRPLSYDDAVEVLAAPLNAEPLISIDRELVDAMFSANATTFPIQPQSVAKFDGVAHAHFIAATSAASIEKCIADVLAHQTALNLPEHLRTTAAMTVKSLLPNLLPMSVETEDIEVAQGMVNGKFTLAVRVPGMEISRRLESRRDSMAARRVVEAEMANLLNLAWFERIAINADGSAMVFVAA